MEVVALPRPSVVPAALPEASCLHCGLVLPVGSADRFCCRGCRIVFSFLTKEGLSEYYALGGRDGVPVPETRRETRDRKWLELVNAERDLATGIGRFSLDLQGVHCTACVWLLETLFRRALGPGQGQLQINPALGRAEFLVDREFPLEAWIEDVESAGYIVGPALRTHHDGGDALQIRLGICLALAMNAMMFAAAVYLGLREGPVYRLVHTLSFLLAVASLMIGGPVFFKGAWVSLRQRSLHFDVPISLGVVLAFTSSLAAFVAGRDAVYFDSVSVFISLMLLGRWLRDRALERNRSTVLESGGVEWILTRRVRNGSREILAVPHIEAGDTLSIARGELVPVDARLVSPGASFSLDWITGEGEAKEFSRGAVVPAGAFNAGSEELEMVAETSFSASPLPTLVERRNGSDGDTLANRWWDGIARRYVGLVLGIASAVATYWWFRSHDVWRVLEVTTSVLVITCPCAFGLAAPMVYELALAGLRRSGVFVRKDSFIDRARRVTRVVFDKTGTLTTGVLEVQQASGPMDALTHGPVLLAMAERSAHPKSVAVARYLRDRGIVPLAEVAVAEVPGSGLTMVASGHRYQLGEPSWIAASVAGKATTWGDGADVLLAVDGEALAWFETSERLRPEAGEELRALRRGGYDVFLLSGDRPDRVRSLAATLGFADDHAFAQQRPEDKAAWIRRYDHKDTLMIGDGINDSLAVSAAWCSGTPAVDRPFMHERTDFYWTHPGIAPVALSLRVSRYAAQVLRALLGFAWAYNAVAIGVATMGLMKPWIAAVLMPASSIVILLGTRAALGTSARIWKS